MSKLLIESTFYSDSTQEEVGRIILYKEEDGSGKIVRESFNNLGISIIATLLRKKTPTKPIATISKLYNMVLLGCSLGISFKFTTNPMAIPITNPRRKKSRASPGRT